VLQCPCSSCLTVPFAALICLLAGSCDRGLPPKHDRPTPKLSKEDMQMALKRGGTERDDYDAGERVEGIGLAP